MVWSAKGRLPLKLFPVELSVNMQFVLYLFGLSYCLLLMINMDIRVWSDLIRHRFNSFNWEDTLTILLGLGMSLSVKIFNRVVYIWRDSIHEFHIICFSYDSKYLWDFKVIMLQPSLKGVQVKSSWFLSVWCRYWVTAFELSWEKYFKSVS